MLKLSHLSRVQLFVTLWTIAHQAPPGDLSNPGIKPGSPMSSALQAYSLPLSLLGSPIIIYYFLKIIFMFLFIFHSVGSLFLHRLFTSCNKWAYSLVVVFRLLIAVAYLIMEHGL